MRSFHEGRRYIKSGDPGRGSSEGQTQPSPAKVATKEGRDEAAPTKALYAGIGLFFERDQFPHFL
ncbi:MAG: hypothetical protein BGO55_20600 [Sphingobacteriales bacterium 50-39]|nr:MAG: hypothetical protein BGO55_20600 [Sphingobacteriales bacterium 50-39]